MKASDSSSSPSKASSEFRAFEGLAKALISVPKHEVEKKAKEYERKKQARKRGKPPK